MSRETSRREFLTALLGVAPLALLGGCADSAQAFPEGDFAGPSVGFGHRLQQDWRPQPAADAWTKTGILIVGGGIAGLAAAWRLKRLGYEDFLLLELEEQAGGTSRQGNCATSAFPWGAHYLPAPQADNVALVRLLKEMDVIAGADSRGEPTVREQYLCRAPQERIFYRGRWYEGLYLHAGAEPDDLRQFAAFQKEIDHWVAWRDGKGRRAFTLPRARASDDAEVQALDRLSMADFLSAKGFTSPRLLWYLDYACRDDYGSHLENTSAWAGLFYFAARIPQPAESAEPIITWPEGNGRLASYLCNEVAAHVLPAMAVTGIAPAGNAERDGVAVVAFDRRKNRPAGFQARRVIFAAPQFLRRHLVKPSPGDENLHFDDFEYAPWLVANLQLREHPESNSFPLAWDNVFHESESLGYVAATHQTNIERGPTVLTFYHAFCQADAHNSRRQLLAGTWRDLTEWILADMARAHPSIQRLAQRVDIMRWGHAMIRPRPGFMWSAALRKAREPFRGIHFANTDLSGMALFEEAYGHGLRAAEEAYAALGLELKERWA